MLIVIFFYLIRNDFNFLHFYTFINICQIVFHHLPSQYFGVSAIVAKKDMDSVNHFAVSLKLIFSK